MNKILFVLLIGLSLFVSCRKNCDVFDNKDKDEVSMNNCCEKNAYCCQLEKDCCK